MSRGSFLRGAVFGPQDRWAQATPSSLIERFAPNLSNAPLIISLRRSSGGPLRDERRWMRRSKEAGRAARPPIRRTARVGRGAD